ncbi:MAG: hypothetical protein ACQEWL_17810 [Pseudomonadota bacterium]
MRKYIFIKRLYLAIGIDKELLYTTRKNDSKLYAFFHIAYCPDFSPKVGLKLSVFNFTLPFVIFHLGWVTRRKQALSE